MIAKVRARSLLAEINRNSVFVLVRLTVISFVCVIFKKSSKLKKKKVFKNSKEMEDNKVHLRHCMLYEFRKGLSVGTAQKNIQSVYLDRAPALRTVKKWFGRFRQGNFSLEDEPRSGRPSGLDNDVVRTLVKARPRITTEEIAETLSINKSTAFRRLKQLGYISKLDTWVPHCLTERNKLNRMNVALSLQARHEKDPFLDRLVTGDEKWVLYNNVQRKRTWKQTGEKAEPVAKAGLHPMKVLLCVWWDCQWNYSL